MKHIMHIAPTPFFADRGCHIRIEGIVRCLHQLGYTNTVCTYHHGRDVATVSTKRISPIKNYTQTTAGPSKFKLWADWKLLWLSLAEYRRSKPDVIHAHLHEGLLIGILVKWAFFWRGTPLVADMQGSLTGELESHGAFDKIKPLKWLTHLFERTLMWFPTAIICSSKHSLDKLQAEFRIPQHKISLAQDGADEPEPDTLKTRSDTRARLKIPNDKIVAVYSGALLASKGLNELKEIIAASRDAPIHFLLIGYPTDNIEPFLISANLFDQCSLTGQVDFAELPNLLKASDIAIDPKNSDAGEGSGKMLNYLACGLPILAFDTANNREFLPNNTELKNDTGEIAHQLKLLASDSEQRKSLAKSAQQHFRQHYSWQVTRKQLQSVYERL